MSNSIRSHRRVAALVIWVAGLILFICLGVWNLESSRRDAENRLISEAGRAASQLASLLSASVLEPDEISVRAVVSGAMDDDRIYAIKVDSDHGMIEGQRRNYMWEPVPWDDEIAENSVQGMNTFKVDGQPAGTVNVWLSPRLNDEEDSLLANREILRFILAAAMWTGALLLLLWYWGDFRRFGSALGEKTATPSATPHTDALAAEGKANAAAANSENGDNEPVIDARLGRRHQRRNMDAWLVTAGMFRQTFARGPALISRLYAEGETAGLCHLGRMLEQAAPCVGASRLARAAHKMQEALNDPDCQARAMPVEECAKALDEVLNALCGNGQWRSKPGSIRS